jgi:hypothetical protein
MTTADIIRAEQALSRWRIIVIAGMLTVLAPFAGCRVPPATVHHVNLVPR